MTIFLPTWSASEPASIAAISAQIELMVIRLVTVVRGCPSFSLAYTSMNGQIMVVPVEESTRPENISQNWEVK